MPASSVAAGRVTTTAQGENSTSATRQREAQPASMAPRCRSIRLMGRTPRARGRPARPTQLPRLPPIRQRRGPSPSDPRRPQPALVPAGVHHVLSSCHRPIPARLPGRQHGSQRPRTAAGGTNVLYGAGLVAPWSSTTSGSAGRAAVSFGTTPSSCRGNAGDYAGALGQSWPREVLHPAGVSQSRTGGGLADRASSCRHSGRWRRSLW